MDRDHSCTYLPASFAHISRAKWLVNKVLFDLIGDGTPSVEREDEDEEDDDDDDVSDVEEGRIKQTLRLSKRERGRSKWVLVGDRQNFLVFKCTAIIDDNCNWLIVLVQDGAGGGRSKSKRRQIDSPIC